MTLPHNHDDAAAAASGKQHRATVLGCVAILLWSSMFGVNAHLNETVGTLWSGALSYLGAGGIGLGILVGQRRLGAVLALPRRYLLGRGLLFALYSVPLFVALQMSSGAAQAIEVSLINYLWPALILGLSVPVLGARARWSLPLGLLAATAGVVLVLGRGAWSVSGVGQRLQENGWPYGLMFAGAVCWALFSLLTRRWMPAGGGAASGALSLFFLASGLLLLALALAHGVNAAFWTPRVFAEIAFLALFPSWLAYSFWDSAMRGGDMVLVTAASYLTPLFSTLFSCLYLHLSMDGRLWLGCVLLIAGAAVCKVSVREPVAPAAAR